MERKIILTNDGSHSISVPELNVTYHSIHGAIQESMHVFIEAGLRAKQRSEPFNLLEIGFGTGLNALLTLIESEKFNEKIYYEAIDTNPLDEEMVRSLNYCEILGRPDIQDKFELMHRSEWDKEISITDSFSLKKSSIDLSNTKLLELFSPRQSFELIYFDAFAPSAQPELWEQSIFEKIFSLMTNGGILVTYCSKADVRRAMQAAGFKVEKIPGPWGKREMLRARKVDSL